MTAPFCDFLSASFPLERLEEVSEAVKPLMDVVIADTAKDGATWIYRPRSGGSVRVGKKYQVGMLSASGGALSALRVAGAYEEYLMVLGVGAHRVTRLDATVDLALDAPPAIAALTRRAREGRISLSRKSVPPGDVETRLSLDCRGVLTGTVYLGSPSARVRGAIYDKRHERECANAPDPGPTLRLEIRVRGDVGVSLHDACDCSSLFFHFASPDLIDAPSGVIPWTPHNEGFKVERRNWLPEELLAYKVDHSPEIERLIELAFAAGPGGPAFLLKRLGNRLCRSVRVTAPLDDVGRAKAARTESLA